MSIESAVAEIEAQDNDSTEANTEEIVLNASENASEPVAAPKKGKAKAKETNAIEAQEMPAEEKRGRGRPMLHEWAGRPYFLNNEKEKFFENPDYYETLMIGTYEISEERKAELANANLIGDDNAIVHTISGPIKYVHEELTALYEKYGKDYIFEYDVIKESLVPQSHALYQKPKEEALEKTNKKGQNLMRKVWAEYNPNRMTIKVTVTKA